MIRAVAIFSMALLLSVCSYAQTNDENYAPKIKVILQAGSPVSIDEYTSYPNRMKVMCRVTNQSDQRIVAVRLGWFVTSGDQETITKFAEIYYIPAGLRPTASIGVSPLRIPDLQGIRTARITIFVAEVLYSNGYKWRTDINSLRSELKRRLRNVVPRWEEIALSVRRNHS
jgi:hypothetical protein